MSTYTYEEIYSDPAKGIIRSEEDANIAGLKDSEDICVVVDRKWGECTPAEFVAYFNSGEGNSEKADPNAWSQYGMTRTLYKKDSSDLVSYDETKTYTIVNVFWVGGHTEEFAPNVVYLSNKNYAGEETAYLYLKVSIGADVAGSKPCGVKYTVSEAE